MKARTRVPPPPPDEPMAQAVIGGTTGHPASVGESRFAAFISYAHASDATVAPALRSALQTFAKPWYRRRALRVFLDEASLAADPGLWSAVRGALDDSRHLVVLASPESARSEWVEREIAYWCEHREVEDIIIVRTGGTIRWDEEGARFAADTEALGPSLAAAFTQEPRHVDMGWARGAGRLSSRDPRMQAAVADIAAVLHGRPKDDLLGDDVRQHRRTKATAAAGAALLAALAIAASIAAVAATIARNTARSRADASLAMAKLAVDPQESLRLAGQAIDIRPTAEAQDALAEARAASLQLAILHLGGAPLDTVAISADGDIAIGGRDGRVTLWNPSRRLTREVAAPPGIALRASVRMVAFDRKGALQVATSSGLWASDLSTGVSTVVAPGPDIRDAVLDRPGRQLATASASGLRVWRGDGRPVTATLRMPGGATLVALDDRGRRALGVGPDGARLWRLPRGTPMPLAGYSGEATAATFTRSGRFVVIAGDGRSAGVWDARTGRRRAFLRGDESFLKSVDAGRRDIVVTAGSGGTARLWSARSGRQLRVLAGQTGLITRARFSVDGSRLATASDDGTVRVWDVSSGGLRAVLAGHHANVRDIAFSRDGRRIASVGFDGTARLWDVERGGASEIRTIDGSAVLDVAAGPRGSFAAVTYAGTAVVGSGSTLDVTLQLGGSPEPVQVARFDPQGRMVAVADRGGGIALIEPRLGISQPVQAGRGIIFDLAFSPDGRFLASACQDGYVRIIDTRTGVVVPQASPPKHDGPVLAVAFSPDGRRIVSASADGTARIWASGSGKPLTPPLRHDGPVFDATFTPDGRWVVTASQDGTARVWHAADGTLRATLMGHEAPVVSVKVAPDGSRAVTASQDGTARLWRLPSGDPVAVIRGHTAPVLSAEFSPDGRLLATGGEDGTIRVSDALTGRLIQILRGPRSTVTAVAFTAHSDSLIAASTDGFLRRFSLRLHAGGDSP